MNYSTEDESPLGWVKTRLIFAWLVFGVVACHRGEQAWSNFEDVKHPEGNFGHTQIDFGGQYLFGRMVYEGHSKELYQRDRYVEISRQRFATTDQEGNPSNREADRLVYWFPTSEDQQLAGPLYPPIHAFLMTPISMVDRPVIAYRIWQAFMFLCLVAAGWCIRVLTNGRWWWPMASSMLLAFAGARGAIDLGQNTPLTVLILLAGWTLRSRNHPVLAGVVWGCLAFKPVWAISFIGALVLLRQWRMMWAMALTGIALIFVTIPFVGIDVWKNWLTIGSIASQIYNHDKNWISLSRDVFGIPRRFMLQFGEDGQATNDRPLVAYLGWAIWASIATVSAFVCWRRSLKDQFTGPATAFAFCTAWLLTYRFMYYDALVGSVPVMVLLARPDCFLRWSSWPFTTWAVIWTMLCYLIENTLVPSIIRFTVWVERYGQQFSASFTDQYPWDTVAIFLVWLWCLRTVWFRWESEFS